MKRLCIPSEASQTTSPVVYKIYFLFFLFDDSETTIHTVVCSQFEKSYRGKYIYMSICDLNKVDQVFNQRSHHDSIQAL